MSNINLDYNVEDPKSYVIKSGGMKHLYEKAHNGFSLQEYLEQFTLTLKLLSPGIVHFIEMAPYNVKTIIFQLIDKKGEAQEQVTHLFNGNGAAIIEFKASKYGKYVTQRLKVTAHMDSKEQGGMGIRYLIIKGAKQEIVGRPGMQKVTNVSRKPPELHRPSQSPHVPTIRARGNDRLFQQRKRNKETSKDSKRELTEQQQLRKAIQLSKREAEQRGQHLEQSSEWHPIKEEKGARELRGKSRQKDWGRQGDAQRRDVDHWQKFAETKSRDYHLVQLEKIKPFLKDVNAQWLQAQREAEEQLQIEQKHRLSKYIQVRHFNNRTVCVDLPAQKKSQAQKNASQMGAKIVQELGDNMLLVSTRPDSEKVARARKCKNVRVVTPNFIQECKQCQTYLSERDYFLKL